MKSTFALGIGAAAICIGVATVADAPYIGKWKLNAG